MLKVEFLPKFSVSGIWKRWRESYPTEGSKADGAITVFTGVSMIIMTIEQFCDMVHSHENLVFCIWSKSG